MPKRAALLLILTAVTAGCSRQPALFSEDNARVTIGMLADTIGSRPVGTAANAQARAYLTEQLRLFGFDVRVQETDARRAELGRTARVSNIIAVRQGTRDEAIGLLSHYDSAPESPGGADDGFGVGVTLEAARVLAASANRQWSLMVLITDGEEAGLMGAAALMTDREVTRRLQTYINIEAAGSSDPVMLFETGPGNAWLTRPWARYAPHPRGASFGVEIYKRLPNDTDFSILRRRDIPGLNFAAVGDSYAYHTARDTAERIPRHVVRETGENVVAIASALDAADITARSSSNPTFFDIGGTAAVSYEPGTAMLAALLALAAGVVAWVRVVAAAFKMGGIARWLLTVVWTVLGAALVVASMVGATAAARVAREVYHPWYAHPDRLFLLLLAVGATIGWGVARVGALLPARAHGLRHPVVTWSLALPVWIFIASAALWVAPGAAYLWMLPLLAAGVLLAITPPASEPAIRAVSVIVLAVAGTLWLRPTLELLEFLVAVFGRFPFITPPYVFATLMAVAGVMLVPPFVAATARTKPLLRPSLMTAILLIAVSVTAALAYRAPAYTHDQPLRRHARALQSSGSDRAIWEVASVEPGLDLTPGAPAGWQPANDAPPGGVRWGRLPFPFVFRTSTPALAPAPVAIADFSTAPVADGIEMSLTVIPREPGLWLSFVLPQGVTPARAAFPGVQRFGRWTATYVAPSPDGVTFRASFRGVSADVLRDTVVAVTSSGLPDGEGWQRLPAWLPQDRAVWTASTTWQVPATARALAPVPPLR
jgi:hypothetical protein